MFQPLRPIKERILAYGSYGCGKSYAYLSIARAAQQTNSPSIFHVLDTDNATERMLVEEFPELRNVIVYPAFEFPEYVSALTQIQAAAIPDRNDWVVCDLVCKSWQAAQEYYIERIYKRGVEDFFLEAREKQVQSQGGKKGGSPLDGFKDWTIINRIYSSFADSLILKSRCHLFCAAKGEPVSSDLDSKEIISVFGRIGLKPVGQKALPHNFHSVLLFSQRRPGEYYLTTVKDRGRQPVESQMQNFASDYLCGLAKWQVTP